MARKSMHIQADKATKELLEKWSNSEKIERRLYLRAKIILKCLENQTNLEIAQELQISRFTVSKWRMRFYKEGIKGLYDTQRLGKPKKYGVEFRNKLLKLLETPPPKGQSNWDGKALAKELKSSDDTVWRLLKKEGIQLQRTRSWCVSTDKQFTAKAVDIIGLYLNPPENAIVFCVDEKPSIQAIERKIGFVETSSGKIVRGLKSTYKRNGTLNLFAALNIATGHIKAKTTKQKTRIDFQSFLNTTIEGITEDKEIHIIMDNYCTHKKNEQWLQDHPNVYFHYTPTSASWLNQVEIWFGILTRKALKNNSFDSKDSLKKAIEDFIEFYHENARPFIWRKREVKGSQLRNTIMNLCN
jgi:transposase